MTQRYVGDTLKSTSSANSKQNSKIFYGVYQRPMGEVDVCKIPEVENLVRLSL
jgi:hypothetical protein